MKTNLIRSPLFVSSQQPPEQRAPFSSPPIRALARTAQRIAHIQAISISQATNPPENRATSQQTARRFFLVHRERDTGYDTPPEDITPPPAPKSPQTPSAPENIPLSRSPITPDSPEDTIPAPTPQLTPKQTPPTPNTQPTSRKPGMPPLHSPRYLSEEQKKQNRENLPPSSTVLQMLQQSKKFPK